MKSDREFIEGIYRKAEALQREEALQKADGAQSGPKLRKAENVRRLRVLAGAAAAMLVVCVGTALVRGSGLGTQQEQAGDPGMEMARMMPEGYGVDPAAYTLGDEETESFILTGEVIRVSTSEGSENAADAVIRTDSWLSAAPEGDTSEITVRYQGTDEYGWSVVFAQGEQVMLFLAADEASGDGFYYLQEGSQSKYVFWKEEGDACYYKNAAGVVLDSRVVAAYQE
ncbi:MAG: hypothetical protein J6B85_12085 [Lachnospiraceae bacterium]|nr:hypothetical protein [Lachnospiraceae bacterium]